MSLLYGSRHAVSGRVLIRTAFDFDDSIYIYMETRSQAGCVYGEPSISVFDGVGACREEEGCF